MRILGISCFYHDSAAVLVNDGEIMSVDFRELMRQVNRKEDKDISKVFFGVFDYNLFNFANNLCYFDRFIFMEQKEIKY